MTVRYARTVIESLSAQERLVYDQARDVADQIAPRAAAGARDHRWDPDMGACVAAAGFLGATMPHALGGKAHTQVEYGLICEQVGRASSAVRSLISVQTSLVCGSIERWGTAEQRRIWIPAACSGTGLGCFGLTEPDTGSDVAHLRTTARQQRDGTWRIDGSKMWISWGSLAAFGLIFAQAVPLTGEPGLACFIVATTTEGFDTAPVTGKLGLHEADTAALSLSEVCVPESALLGSVGDGLKVALSALDSGRYAVAAGCTGICQAALDATLAEGAARSEGAVALVGEMQTRTDAARGLVYRAGTRLDAGAAGPTDTAVAKLYASETAVWCTNRALEVVGLPATDGGHILQRLFRDARVTTLYEGTSQIQRLLIGRAVTGTSAFVPAPAPQLPPLL
jgi:butyryl-CoA dehydrogenase